MGTDGNHIVDSDGLTEPLQRQVADFFQRYAALPPKICLIGIDLSRLGRGAPRWPERTSGE
jgi:hypothetical protein